MDPSRIPNRRLKRQAASLLAEIEAMKKRLAELDDPYTYEANPDLHRRLDQLMTEYMRLVTRD